MVAVLGFTTILGAFSGIGVWARLSCGEVIPAGPFNLRIITNGVYTVRFVVVIKRMNNECDRDPIHCTSG